MAQCEPKKALGGYDYDGNTFRGVLASAPSTPEEGWTYINSSDYKYYIYYGGAWQELHTLTPATVYALELEGAVTDLLELEGVGITDCLGI